MTMNRWLLALLLLGCDATLAPTKDAAADLTAVTARDCGDGTQEVPCPGAKFGGTCPKKSWCDTSGATPVCRCGDQETLVGGIGVFFPGATGFASSENSALSSNFNPALPDRSLEAEIIATAATGGSSGSA